ncbi:ATP12 family chaperone protein [Tateyamaria omphalii]|uniref:ATPase n=1 Tax=Tateyamaria omphalii TaxID=299262 RepID=A0A1P8N0U6_9RHOB|nr:ATP12 family protein [Tateyamaria omphalii]APX13878.1 ATPase [Tateyamaria omphalii]
MSEWKQKRFWTAATAEQNDAGWTVTLDGRAIKTPAKAPLVLPTQAMADAVAAEWDAQDEVVNPLSMPFTRSANAAIDKVAIQHTEVADMLAAYGDADLLCYRADAPEELVDRQAATWDPYLDWAGATFGARLMPRTGLMHESQDADALAALSGPVHAMSNFELAAFHDLVSLSGSLILGFAAAQDLHPPLTIWAASRLDETWQEEQWGEDEEAQEVAKIKEGSFLHAKAFFDAAKTG